MAGLLCLQPELQRTICRQQASSVSYWLNCYIWTLQDDRAEGERRLELFKPAFSQLIALICGRVRYPDDWDTWHRDDRDEFRQQRYSVADTLLDAAGERYGTGPSTMPSSTVATLRSQALL